MADRPFVRTLVVAAVLTLVAAACGDPAVSFFIGLAESQIDALGLEFAGQTLVPVDATDLSPFAAQATGSGATRSS